jgi:CTP-dependent riboflavin kinase
VSRLVGRVQSGTGDASRRLGAFNAAYSRKVGMPVFPGSLNLALDTTFDWFAPEIVRRTICFDRAEYGGERDILLVPCVLANLDGEPAWLWTTTTAARDRADPWVVEIIAARNLRESFNLADGMPVIVELLDHPHAAGV